MAGCASKPEIIVLKFTPLEFETFISLIHGLRNILLKFTPLEFETDYLGSPSNCLFLALKFTPLEFETDTFVNDKKSLGIKIYSVGV